MTADTIQAQVNIQFKQQVIGIFIIVFKVMV